RGKQSFGDPRFIIPEKAGVARRQRNIRQCGTVQLLQKRSLSGTETGLQAAVARQAASATGCKAVDQRLSFLQKVDNCAKADFSGVSRQHGAAPAAPAGRYDARLCQLLDDLQKVMT